MKKKCINRQCSTYNILIDTEKESCIICGKPLRNPLQGLFEGLFGKF